MDGEKSYLLHWLAGYSRAGSCSSSRLTFDVIAMRPVITRRQDQSSRADRNCNDSDTSARPADDCPITAKRSAERARRSG